MEIPETKRFVVDKRPATVSEPLVTVPSGIVFTGIAGPNETPEKLKPFVGAVENIMLLPETI